MEAYTKFNFSNFLKPGITSMALLCAVVMAFGWGWRGNYGHEAGAMLPGALMAMAAVFGSGREDWYRRTLIIGLFGAIGWSFGGSMSYMEHNYYITSDSFPDVAYGYFGFGFIALLWTGVGAAILALAFTKRISELEKYVHVALVIASFWFLEYLYFVLLPDQNIAFQRFGVEVFNDSEWFAALTTLLISSVYWLLRPKERKEAALYVRCAVGWWVGYLTLTKFGGLELAPPNRSESWGGNLGILVVLLVHHYNQKNRAALMFTNYAMLIGPIAYIIAVFIHLPVRIGWLGIPSVFAWKLAEEGFGFFMGLGIALGIAKFIKGGLAKIPDDGNKKHLDLLSAFFLVIVMMVLNLQKNVIDWGNRYHILPDGPNYGLFAWQWFLLTALFCIGVVIYCMWLYHKGKLILVPKTAVEKGIVLFMILITISLVGIAGHRINDWKPGNNVIEYVSYFFLAFLTIFILITTEGNKDHLESPPTPVSFPEDKKWNLSWKFWRWWSVVPILIVLTTLLTLGMDDGSYPMKRKRFGPDAYWRQMQKQAEELKK